ncbi:Uncharacterised protein [uncultured archaeon]|nr:Uncharacterised protein [uncultured archaeon]
MHPKVQEAFDTLTRTLLGRSLGPIGPYEAWLRQNTRPDILSKSPISGRTVYSPPLSFYYHILSTALKEDEAAPLGARHLSEADALSINLSNAKKLTRSLAFHTPEWVIGQNEAVDECGIYGFSSFCSKGSSFVHSKYSGYSFWPRNSEYLFGVNVVFHSKFCLKCYNSVNLTRCFEVSHSSNSSDCYFCYNVDACSECLFCTNAKSLRYAIFNHSYPKEEYLRVKKLVLAEISAKLQKDQKLDLNVFNVGCPK